MGRWGREHRVADRGEREVAERAGAVPALVCLVGVERLGPCVRIDVRKGLEPVDPREPVARLAARLGVEKVVGERGGVGIGEAEGAQPVQRLGQERTGSALNVCRPA